MFSKEKLMEKGKKSLRNALLITNSTRNIKKYDFILGETDVSGIELYVPALIGVIGLPVGCGCVQ